MWFVMKIKTHQIIFIENEPKQYLTYALIENNLCLFTFHVFFVKLIFFSRKILTK